VPLREDVAAAVKGDASALERPQKGKGKKRSPAEVVAGLSAKQRSTLRARAEEIIAAIDEYEAENEEEDVDAEVV
jgi:hypothetical protein